MTIRHRTTSALAATALALGIGGAEASATGLPNGSLVAATATVPAAPSSSHVSQPSSQPTILRVTSSNGFHWGDAGIGAAGGFALSMIGFGVVMTLSQQRTRHNRHGPA